MFIAGLFDFFGELCALLHSRLSYIDMTAVVRFAFQHVYTKQGHNAGLLQPCPH